MRVGDTVRRPARYSTHLMRDALLHLERVGFDAAPRWQGVDEHNRDILSWIEGETYTERSQMHPYIGEPPARISFRDQQLAAAMKLLRRYHDTFTSEVICHGDYGPWNIIWRQGLPYAIIDFANAHTGDPSEDVAYALRVFLGYGLVEAPPQELALRTRIMLHAYGRSFDVAAILEREYDLAEERCRLNGWERQLAKLPAERAWLASHRGAFTASVSAARLSRTDA